MGWHVRYIDRSLKHELLSPEFPTRDEAFEKAWTLAQQKNDISAIEGPDEELVSMEEIGAWFDRRASRKDAIHAIPEAKKPKKHTAVKPKAGAASRFTQTEPLVGKGKPKKPKKPGSRL